MKNDMFSYLPQDMKWREMSIREADTENEVFMAAFEAMLEREGIAQDDYNVFLYLDLFKDGWEAAVEALKDD